MLLLDQQALSLDPFPLREGEIMGDSRYVVEAVRRDERFRERG